MGRTCSVRMEEDRNALKILTGTPTGKRFLGRPMCRWVENITKDLNEIGVNTRNSTNSAQDINYWSVPVNVTLKLQVPYALKSVS